VLKRTMLNFENTVLNLNLRLESIDYNVNTFQDSGATIYDHVRAVVGGISLRPSANTVLRANYRYHWSRDFVGTPTSRTVGIQVGFASYF
jgi:hypothetical protein